MQPQALFQPGNIVRARGREWVVLPEARSDLLRLRPLGGGESNTTLIYLPLESHAPRSATFPLPDPSKSGAQAAGLLMRDALRLKLRAGAGPFRSFGNLAVEPRAYQLVPLLMALRQEVVRLLIADEVGIGKTIEAGLIARELLDRGEIERLAVICPPHLCEQWQRELSEKFNLTAEVVRSNTAARLERGLPAGQSLFDVYPFTVVSLDFIKSARRRDEFVRACPAFVIVEEAHACVGGTGSRHLRYQLLRALAADADRHMVFLTATPHSGDEEAFHNLLGLLHKSFKNLQDMEEGQERTRLREQLARYFVQRRRPDIQEWKDSTLFPDRETAEVTYTLTGDWGKLFDAILRYARALVARSSGQSKLRQRMSWWAALALLRCASSSPAAAALALRTRLKVAKALDEVEQLAELDQRGCDSVFDGADDDSLMDENVPAGVADIGTAADAPMLETLIQQADALCGIDNDPKLAALVHHLKQLIVAGFQPVVFCRYIATAHYVAERLSKWLPNVTIRAVTGELTSAEREAEVQDLGASEGARVLVATDCLSEGINLQQSFNAVIHYDLVWNPTRHEQREGRVDRFGQAAKTVRALMLYGANNPVDGAVLKVILHKAEKIRKELGVSVPMPMDHTQVTETIMQTVLLRDGGLSNTQYALDLGELDQQIELSWESAKAKAKRGQLTVFSQQRLRPADVLPEWRKMAAVLGGEDDVARFIRTAAERLHAPLEPLRGYYRLPLSHLPLPVREQLAAMGIDQPFKLTFHQPASAGTNHIHRTHPLVSALADHIAERGLAEENADLASRSGAVFTDAVSARTTLYLLRLRNQLGSKRGGSPWRHLLAEECVIVKLDASGELGLLDEEDAVRLMSAEPSRNMMPVQRERQVQRALDALASCQGSLNRLAETRADNLLADHTRVRAASAGRKEAMGIRYEVKAALPVDVIGAYVLIPTPSL